MSLTQEKLKSLYHYNPKTGKFHSLNPKTGKPKKKSLKASNGVYRNIRIDGVNYKQHRLAWLYVHGHIPEIVDHINGRKTDNRLSNLRAADYLTNAYNRRKLNKCRVPYKGVTLYKGRYRSRLSYRDLETKVRKSIHLGQFQSAVEAALAYDLHALKMFKDFANLNFPHLRNHSNHL